MLAPYHARLRAELERHGGTVEKFIGDAVMALFGAPVVHEDDPERAVRAALAIRDWARDDEGGLHVRVGVTTGEALVTLGARPRRAREWCPATSSTRHLGCRRPRPVDGILVDETTLPVDRARDRVPPAEPVVAKGKESPVPVWAVVAARSRFGVDVAAVGRRRSWAGSASSTSLRGALARVRGEREPQLVTIVGVPGIGKSRLVWELFRTVDAASRARPGVRAGRCPYGDGVTYWALSEMVKAEAGILETDADAAGERSCASRRPSSSRSRRRRAGSSATCGRSSA